MPKMTMRVILKSGVDFAIIARMPELTLKTCWR